jgi:hypothetical protein
MAHYEEIDVESYAQGWRKTIQEAVDAALAEANVPVGEEREVDVIYGRKRNPFHEYRATLR